MLLTKKFKKLVAAPLVLASTLILSACDPVSLAIGAGAAAGSMALEERGFEQAVVDRDMAYQISQALSKHGGSDYINVSVNVIEGRTLLTGTVSDRQLRLDAIELAWKVDGVEEVFNEIQVTDNGGFLDLSRDLLIKSNLSSAITFDDKIHAVNYNTSVVNGTVYLFGIAQNDAELDQLIAQTKQISYVRRVIPIVQLKDDPARLDWLKKQKEKPETDS
ncbi:BON domain-containing protein [Curvivirga sp.]|uniref:BON domain-containing protein n=1 Tax=Curvivirga sp. TaxID=2856848 RepID=UPI003B5C5A47